MDGDGFGLRIWQCELFWEEGWCVSRTVEDGVCAFPPSRLSFDASLRWFPCVGLMTLDGEQTMIDD